MSSLSKFIIINNLKRLKNLVLMFVLTLITCIILNFMQSINLIVTDLDYFFVVWFMSSIMYIYYICDIATYDFDNRIINFVYSAGYSRDKYLINKLILFLLIGFIHGLTIFFTYKVILPGFILSDGINKSAQVLIIYPLIFVLIGSFNYLLSLFDCSKSKIIIINTIIMIILPTLIEMAIMSIGNDSLWGLFSISPFELISTTASELNLNNNMFIIAIVTIIILNAFNIIINRKKDF